MWNACSFLQHLPGRDEVVLPPGGGVVRIYHVLVSANSRAQTVEELEGRRKRVVVQVLDTLHADVCRAVDAAFETAEFEQRVAKDGRPDRKGLFIASIKDESAAHMAVCKALPNGAPTRRSRHKQPYSDQPRFRCTSLGLVAFLRCPRGRAARKRCTATAYAGFPGAQVQRSVPLEIRPTSCVTASFHACGRILGCLHMIVVATRQCAATAQYTNSFSSGVCVVKCPCSRDWQ